MNDLRFIGDQTPINVQAPSSTQEPEYPSLFFQKGLKPTLRVPNTKITLERARNLFAGSLAASIPNLQLGKEYVYLLMDIAPEENEADWSSYGIKIAAAGDPVKVWDLFKVQLKDSTVPPNSQEKPAQAESDLGLLILFCSAYRLVGITDTNYMALVAARIASQAISLPTDTPTPETLVALVVKWLSDPDYLKMISGLDMFFHRFPKSLYNQARIGTLSARYRDCASLLSVRFFLHIVGTESLQVAAAWITYEPVAKDLIRMMRIGEETAVDSSYFPYQSDMGLVRKSSYSTVTNPSYFYFVQAVGALLGLERSRNARMNLEFGLTGATANAFLVAYIHKRNHEQKLQFTPGGQELVVEEGAGDLERDGETIRSNSPVKWARFMMSRNWILTEFMKTTIKGMQAELIETELRKGSIGEFLSTHSID